MVGLSYIPEYEDMDEEYYDTEFIKIAQQTTPENYFSFKNRNLLFNCLVGLELHKYLVPPSGYVPELWKRYILEIGIGKKRRFLNKLLLQNKMAEITVFAEEGTENAPAIIGMPGFVSTLQEGRIEDILETLSHEGFVGIFHGRIGDAQVAMGYRVIHGLDDMMGRRVYGR